ncbi:protein gamma response 1 [Argentina anserina]|uniref:protein gamma response 1 n=1 Tax=Argentina anserina TaxID=57926 RepID=UPI0021764E12|nr:protein gamma response 1 [Potentilla anserina]
MEDTQSPDIKLATLLLATIQEAKDRIQETRDRVLQIEYVFLAQLYPLFQSKSEALRKFRHEWKSKETDLLLQIDTLRAENHSLKLDRDNEEVIERLRDEVESVQVRSDALGRLLEQKTKEANEGMELQSKLMEEVKSKESVIVSKEKQLKESEESRNVLFARVSDLERRADGLQEELREKVGQVDKGNEVKQNLFKKIESQASEIMNNEKLLKDQEEEKKLMLAKFKIVEENVSQLQKELLTKNKEVEDFARENNFLLRKMAGLEEKVSELQGNLRGRAGEVAKRRGSTENLHQEVELITADLLNERKKYGELTAAYKSLKSQHSYLRAKFGLTKENMLPQNKLEGESVLLRNDQNPSTFHDLEDNERASPDACNTKKMKNEICFNNKLKDDKGHKPIQAITPYSLASKCPSTVKSAAPVAGRKRSASPWIDTRSRQGQNGPDPHDDFLDTPIENIRANLNRSTKEKVPDLQVPVQDDLNLGSSDDETQDVTADGPNMQKQPMPVTVVGKNGFKYVEPVRKKAERENLKGVECKQCKKFYDAVLPDDGGKDNDKHGFRCEHHEGVSRHRYMYLPPSTPEGFWNIGFESEI